MKADMQEKFRNRSSISRKSDRQAQDLKHRFQVVSERSFRKSRPRWRAWSSRAWLGTGLLALTTLYLFYSWIWNSNLWPSQQALLRTSSVRSCAEARRIGVTPLYRGLAGYQTVLDADKDGIACEPYPF
jgi:hypothetical protein